jgi:predicted DNA-binding antitoxin AbrB/MazE fold protein
LELSSYFESLSDGSWRFELAAPDFSYNAASVTRVLLSEVGAMALTVEATYENGVLRPVQPPPSIQEGARVWLTLHIAAEEDRVCKAYGLVSWKEKP